VERRFRYYDFLRRDGGSRAAPAVLAAVLIAVGVTSGAAWSQGGWVWRSSSYYPSDFVRQQMSRRYANVAGVCNLGNGAHCTTPMPADRRHVLVIGDSHATDGLNILMPSLAGQYVVLDERPGCPPFTPTSELRHMAHIRQPCLDWNARRLTPDFVKDYDVIVLSVFWDWYTPADAEAFLRVVHEAAPRARVVVLGNYVVLNRPCADRAQRRGMADCFVPANIAGEFRFEDELRALAERYGDFFLSKRDLMCSEGGCAFFADAGQTVPFTWDLHHLSLEFATLVGERARPALAAYLGGNGVQVAGHAGE
jgi:hypothetical protein